jgi:hypothetical protein
MEDILFLPKTIIAINDILFLPKTIIGLKVQIAGVTIGMRNEYMGRL